MAREELRAEAEANVQFDLAFHAAVEIIGTGHAPIKTVRGIATEFELDPERAASLGRMVGEHLQIMELI